MRLKVYLAIIDMTLKDFCKIAETDTTYINAIVGGRMRPGKRLSQDVEDITNGKVKLIEEFERAKLKIEKELEEVEIAKTEFEKEAVA